MCAKPAADEGRAGPQHGHIVWLQVWEAWRTVSGSEQALSKTGR